MAEKIGKKKEDLVEEIDDDTKESVNELDENIVELGEVIAKKDWMSDSSTEELEGAVKAMVDARVEKIFAAVKKSENNE